jgi:hypothetical protein
VLLSPAFGAGLMAESTVGSGHQRANAQTEITDPKSDARIMKTTTLALELLQRWRGGAAEAIVSRASGLCAIMV